MDLRFSTGLCQDTANKDNRLPYGAPKTLWFRNERFLEVIKARLVRYVLFFVLTLGSVLSW